MSDDEPFKLPVPKFIEAPAGDEFTDSEKKLFDETERSHLEWLKRAMQRVPQEMIVAIIIRASCAGAITSGFSKEKFMALVDVTFDVVSKMPARSLAKR